MYGNNRKLHDNRIIFRRSNLPVGEVSLHALTSRLDFKTQESALAFQIGGNPGDITVDTVPISTVMPTPVPLSGNDLRINVINPGASLVIWCPIVPHCKNCNSSTE